MNTKKICPNCKSDTVICPECKTVYPHGKFPYCINKNCLKYNIPLDCSECKLSICNDLTGILDLDQNLIKYN